MKLGGGCLQHACLFFMDYYAFGYVSHNGMSIVILSILQQHPPCSPAQTFPDRDANGTTQLAQLEFMTSYRCGPPVRPSYSLHAGRCTDITFYPCTGL
ncbi:hypothetical protein PBY51_011708 [Eleginops maclovinus]|uniref:Uncharacterized protein n=1 Tax=Eleginops maclovinus TaxID=56733 RepID=A0AAN8ASP2_ELEMC|nr:hypothetical protein PBY51_011708 [Eleginops maclovinus]